jgi:hypothetical protein
MYFSSGKSFCQGRGERAKELFLFLPLCKAKREEAVSVPCFRTFLRSCSSVPFCRNRFLLAVWLCDAGVAGPRLEEEPLIGVGGQSWLASFVADFFFLFSSLPRCASISPCNHALVVRSLEWRRSRCCCGVGLLVSFFAPFRCWLICFLYHRCYCSSLWRCHWPPPSLLRRPFRHVIAALPTLAVPTTRAAAA